MSKEIIAIGDIQGCMESLTELLDQLPKKARLIFVGDLVNRGPHSLQSLRLIKKLCDQGRARVLLGNHDLHLLAVAAKAGTIHKRDTIAEIFKAPDRKELIRWLRRQPLLIDTPDTVFAHAGIPPSWSLEEAKAYAKEIHKALSKKGWKKYLQGMYGSDVDPDQCAGAARMRAILNGFTRMRMISPTGTLDFDLKEGIDRAPAGFKPWFDCPRRVTKTICFGHWSTLGLLLRDDVIAIDTGCLWGGSLTAIRMSDRRIWQVQCPMWAAPSC